MKPETMARKDARTAETLPVFQHRHFAAIAAVFAAGQDEGPGYSSAHEMANMLQRSNPRFDRARFLRACGVQ